MDSKLDLHQDSAIFRGAVVQAAGRSTIANQYTGLGSKRDPSVLSSIVYPYPLTEAELITLYENCGLVRKLVDAYPNEAIGGWVEWTLTEKRSRNYGFDATKLESYLNDLKPTRLMQQGSLRAKIMDASKGARCIRVAYLLLGIDDGLDWNEPVNFDRIESLRWIEVLADQQVVPNYRDGFYEIYLRESREIETIEGRRINRAQVHPSRLLVIGGHPIPQSIDGGWGRRQVPFQSVIQPCFAAWERMSSALAASNAMIKDWSVFAYGLDGLSVSLGAKTPEQRQATMAMLADRFESIQLNKSVMKGIMHDKEKESVTWANRNATGVDPILNQLIDAFLSEADVPRHQLMGTASRTGLGGEGRGLQDRMEWSRLSKNWRQQNWHDLLLYIEKVALAAKDGVTGGRIPEGYGLIFPSTLQLNPLEKAEMIERYTNAYSQSIADGILHKMEVRDSLFRPNEFPMDANIILNEVYDDQLIDELNNLPDEEDITEREEAEEEQDLSEEELETLDAESIDALRADGNRLFFFEENGKKRRTGIIASSAQAARKKCKRGCGRVYKVRALTASESKTASQGGWVRGTASGKNAGGDRQISGYGPSLKRDADEALSDEEWDAIAESVNTAESIEDALNAIDP